MPFLDQSIYDDIHYKNIDEYASRIRSAYLDAIKSVSKSAVNAKLDSNNEFYFSDNASLSKNADSVIKQLYEDVYTITSLGVKAEWDLATEYHNKLTATIYGERLDELPESYKNRYLASNEKAREAFVKRKLNGLDLSDRVWRNTKQFKNDLELALEKSISRGQSANSLATEIKKYLNEPDKLFRRVKDENGVLQLSQNAKNYKSGKGVYRSSFKNAQRLARNETNFAYEASGLKKREQSDSIVGIKISVSASHKRSDDANGVSCYLLQGKYPKTFDFTYKWHVNCKCISTLVLKTENEIEKDLDSIIAGGEPLKSSVNTVKSNPDNFSKYIKENEELWENWKNKPKWINN